MSRLVRARPSSIMRVLPPAVVAVLVACGVVSGEPIKPPVAAQTCEAGACGPALGMANYTCSDGTIAGPTGRCILNQDGTCGWEVVACPPGDAGSDGSVACTDVMCGPRPLVPDVQCDGGGTSGEVCEANDGGCGWVYVPCP